MLVESERIRNHLAGLEKIYRNERSNAETDPDRQHLSGVLDALAEVQVWLQGEALDTAALQLYTWHLFCVSAAQALVVTVVGRHDDLPASRAAAAARLVDLYQTREIGPDALGEMLTYVLNAVPDHISTDYASVIE